MIEEVWDTRIEVGDLVRLHPNECVLMGVDERKRVGLVMAVVEHTQPRSMSVLWHGDAEPYDEYEDGLILVNNVT